MCLAETASAVHDHDHDHGASGIGRRALVAGGAAAALAVALPSPAAARGRRRLADLTHTFTAGFPVYSLGNPTRETLVTIPENGFYSQRWTFAEHSGTHMDVPGHFVTGGRLTPQITPAELIVPVVVVNIAARVARNPDAQLTVDDLRRFERRHGRIERGAAVFMYSGWERRLPLGEQAYRGQDAAGVYHFPGFHVDAVRWLLERRGITAIGVDTLSLDHGPSTTFDVHTLLLGADRYGLENVANLAKIPPRGATAYVGVVPWERGSGGPCRVIASW
ncbi:MAG TPA: cyclase family protein [Pilimelia sp.]|nr:cyclase family protein [Pilimelia sp.]